MSMDDRDDTNDSSLGAPGEEPRATMVPPTSLSTYVSILFLTIGRAINQNLN